MKTRIDDDDDKLACLVSRAALLDRPSWDLSFLSPVDRQTHYLIKDICAKQMMVSIKIGSLISCKKINEKFNPIF